MSDLVDLNSAEFRRAAKDVVHEELKVILTEKSPDEHIALMLYEQIKDSVTFRQEVLGDIADFKTEVAARFSKVEGRLDGVEGRLGKVEGCLEKVEGRLEKVELKLDKVPTKEETVQLINQQTEKVIDSVRKMFQEYHTS